MTALARVLWAFLRRDILSSLSYRLGMALEALSIVLSVATFYFVAKLLGPQAAPALAPYGGDYFPFVLVGLAFSAYQNVGLHSLAQSIRHEQYLGTLESVLAAPVGVPAFLLGSAQWDFLAATLQVSIYLLAGTMLFGAGFPLANLPAAALALAFTLAALASIGLLSAAFILKFKRGDPVAWVLGAVSELLGGVYFPLSLLPEWLRGLSLLVPMSHALEALRLSLLKSATIAQIAPRLAALAAFTVILLPLGLLAFRAALREARADGTLGHY